MARREQPASWKADSPTGRDLACRKGEATFLPWPDLALRHPVVVLQPDTPVVLHERLPGITPMSGSLPSEQGPLELAVSLGDADRLRLVEDQAAHGRIPGPASQASASVTSSDQRQYNPNPARLGASCSRAHSG